MSSFIEEISTITEQVQIHPDFTLEFSPYPPLSPDPDVLARIKYAPIDIQAKYITEKLQAYLTNIFFDRLLTADRLGVIDQDAPTKLIANNTIAGFNTVFYQQLALANQGQGYDDSGWAIVSIETDEQIVVLKDGLHLHIPLTQIPIQQRNAVVGDLVAIRLPKNIRTRNRYIAIGNQGRIASQSIVNIYFNCPTTSILDLTTQLTSELNQANLAFELQIDPNPDRHHRCEPAILSLAKSDYLLAKPVLCKISREIGAEFRQTTPLGTKVLAPGIAVAEVYTTNEDTGNHHCGAIAYALAQAWIDEITNPDAKRNLILETLADAGIDPDRPYLLQLEEDLPSMDIYTAFG